MRFVPRERYGSPGKEAVDYSKKGRIDVIVLDLPRLHGDRMPSLANFARCLAKLGKRPRI